MERMNSARMEGDPMVSQEVEVPCPEVGEKPVRRRFTAEYKRKILLDREIARRVSSDSTTNAQRAPNAVGYGKKSSCPSGAFRK